MLHRCGRTECPLLCAKFHPHWCNDKGIRPPKLKFYWYLIQMWNICPTGAYSLRDFHKICRICTSFQDALAVKVSLDLPYGGVLIWQGLVSPKFSVPPSSKTMRQMPKMLWRCKNVLEILYHHAKFGGVRISVFEFFCLSVTLFLSHFWTSEFVRPIPWRRWSTDALTVKVSLDLLLWGF